MNHKRSGPKSTRAGCLWCKPHKRQGWSAARRYGKEFAIHSAEMREGMFLTLDETPAEHDVENCVHCQNERDEAAGLMFPEELDERWEDHLFYRLEMIAQC